MDELERTPGGRIDRDSADEVFARRKAETEDAPGDWRSWFRLAVAYHDARDTPRARKAMQRAIAPARRETGRGLIRLCTRLPERDGPGPPAPAGRPITSVRTGPITFGRSAAPVLRGPGLDRVGGPVEGRPARQEVGAVRR